MNETTRAALEAGGVIDITTIGARSGAPRRIEIVFHHFDGEYFITGMLGRKRDWLANLKTNPGFTLHLKKGLSVDLPATATEISDPADRARVLRLILVESWDNPPEKADHILPRWVEGAPLVQFTVD